MKNAKTILLLPLVIFLSCSNNKEKGSITETNYISIPVGLNSPHSSLADSILIEKVTKLETVEKSIISKDYAIKRILTHDNKIYVLDRKFMSVKVFNIQGSYLYDLGSLGNGLAEFTNLQDIGVDTQTHNIWLLCNTPNKIIEFSSAGKFLKEKEFRFFASALGFEGNKNIYFFNNQNSTPASSGKNLIITDNKMIVKDALFDLPKKLTSSVDFTGNIYTCGSEIFFNAPFDNTVFKMINGNAKAAYKINFGVQSTPKDIPTDSINYYLLNKASMAMFFVKSQSFVGFKYFDKGEPTNTFYNIESKRVFSTDTTLNKLNKLFTNNIFQDDKHFIVLLNYDVIGPFLRTHKKEVLKYFPLIYEGMLTYKKNDNPTLAYFKVK